MNEKAEARLKDVEVRLIAELMKNSRRSDRELAKAVRASQPTVSRIIRRLEKEGVIREYTMIPDFNKIGYHICALNFAHFETPRDLNVMRKMIEEYGKRLSEIPQAVLIERGIGKGSNGIVISIHQSYSDYTKFLAWLKQFLTSTSYTLEHFIIDLDDKTHYRYLTFSTLAVHFLKMKGTEGAEANTVKRRPHGKAKHLS